MKIKTIVVNIRYYLSPFFLSRHYLLRDINKVINKFNFSGNLLDVGCGSKPYKKYFSSISSYKGIDFKSHSIHRGYVGESPDFYFSDQYLKDFKLVFDDNSFDITTAFQVLEHHKKPPAMVSEMFRVTKNGGYILITAPFLGGLHEEPNDYQRYTKYGLIELFSSYNCEILEILEQGSLSSSITMLINEYINNLIARGGVLTTLGMIMYIPMFIFQYLSLFLDYIFITKKICFNYLILIKKIK